MRTLYFCPVVSFYLFLLLAWYQRSQMQIGCLPYFDTWCGLSANLECLSEMCCTRLAGNTRCKKSPSAHHRTTLSGYIFATKARIDNQKNLVKQQYLLHMSLQYGKFQPTSGWNRFVIVWGTPADFNGFASWRRYCTPPVGISQTLRRWTDGATYIRQGGHYVGHWPTF